MKLTIPQSEHLALPGPYIENIVFGARDYYTEELDYHNFDHALSTVNSALADFVLCRSNGLDPNLRVVVAAAAHHDNDYYKPLEDSGFASKEERSAFIARGKLSQERRGYTIDELNLVQGAILATRLGEKPKNLEDKIVLRADIANIAGPYTGFLLSFWRLFREQQKLTGKFLPGTEWREQSVDVLLDYLNQDLSYGEFDKNPNGVCRFAVRALRNIGRLKAEPAEQLDEIAQKLVK